MRAASASFPGARARFVEAPGRPFRTWVGTRSRCSGTAPCSRASAMTDYAYFVHSYALPVSEATVASCRYGAAFSACVAVAQFLRGAVSSRALRRGRARACCENFLDRRSATIRLMRLIPAIDLRGGRCVRLLQGRFRGRDALPRGARRCSRKYRGLGADWIHVVDLDGARDGSAGNRAHHRGARRRARRQAASGRGSARYRGGRADARLRARRAWSSAAPP